MTALLVLLSLAYAALAVASLYTTVIPFEVFLWGGLILIFGWWACDPIHNREVVA